MFVKKNLSSAIVAVYLKKINNMPNLSLLPRTKTINASLDLPGSKSIANRVLLLAAVAKGTSIIHNVPDVSEDVVLMLEALKHLGVRVNKLNTKNS